MVKSGRAATKSKMATTNYNWRVHLQKQINPFLSIFRNQYFILKFLSIWWAKPILKNISENLMTKFFCTQMKVPIWNHYWKVQYSSFPLYRCLKSFFFYLGLYPMPWCNQIQSLHELIHFTIGMNLCMEGLNLVASGYILPL